VSEFEFLEVHSKKLTPTFQHPFTTPLVPTEPKIREKGRLNENFLHVTKAKIAILM
jgi:hypothetical protein